MLVGELVSCDRLIYKVAVGFSKLDSWSFNRNDTAQPNLLILFATSEQIYQIYPVYHGLFFTYTASKWAVKCRSSLGA